MDFPLLEIDGALITRSFLSKRRRELWFVQRKAGLQVLLPTRNRVTDPASPAPKLTSRYIAKPDPLRHECVASGLIGVTVSKEAETRVSSFSDSLKRIRSVFAPSTTEIGRISPRVAEATRLYPFPAVVPYFHAVDMQIGAPQQAVAVWLTNIIAKFSL